MFSIPIDRQPLHKHIRNHTFHRWQKISRRSVKQRRYLKGNHGDDEPLFAKTNINRLFDLGRGHGPSMTKVAR